MHTPEPTPGPKARRVRLEKVGTYMVGELGEGRYIVLDDTFSNCYLVEASGSKEAVEVVEGVWGGRLRNSSTGSTSSGINIRRSLVSIHQVLRNLKPSFS
jgi:hypothetical protein